MSPAKLFSLPARDLRGSLNRVIPKTAAGVLYESCSSYPFGDSLSCTGGDVSPMHFTGKERDTESGNDYFGARYYGAMMGRFMSPDWADKPEAVPYSSLTDPQTLNLYGYMRNNPLGGTDKDGLHQTSWLSKMGLLKGIR
jgi:RHS repeat-associated protein